MSEPTTVTYSIAEVLKRIEDKIDSNQKEIKEVNVKLEKLNTIEVKLATIETELKAVDKRLERVEKTQDTLVTEVSDLKGFRFGLF